MSAPAVTISNVRVTNCKYECRQNWTKKERADAVETLMRNDFHAAKEVAEERLRIIKKGVNCQAIAYKNAHRKFRNTLKAQSELDALKIDLLFAALSLASAGVFRWFTSVTPVGNKRAASTLAKVISPGTKHVTGKEQLALVKELDGLSQVPLHALRGTGAASMKWDKSAAGLATLGRVASLGRDIAGQALGIVKLDVKRDLGGEGEKQKSISDRTPGPDTFSNYASNWHTDLEQQMSDSLDGDYDPKAGKLLKKGVKQRIEQLETAASPDMCADSVIADLLLGWMKQFQETEFLKAKEIDESDCGEGGRITDQLEIAFWAGYCGHNLKRTGSDAWTTTQGKDPMRVRRSGDDLFRTVPSKIAIRLEELGVPKLAGIEEEGETDGFGRYAGKWDGKKLWEWSETYTPPKLFGV